MPVFIAQRFPYFNSRSPAFYTMLFSPISVRKKISLKNFSGIMMDHDNATYFDAKGTNHIECDYAV